jgi:hypothetical protein
MGRDPDPRCGDLLQQSIKARPVSTVLDRIDPDQHPVEDEDLRPNRLQSFVGVDNRLDAYPALDELRE